MQLKINTLHLAHVFRHFCLKARLFAGVLPMSLILLAMLARADPNPNSSNAPTGSTQSKMDPSSAWPNRPIRLVVPFPPAGLGDTMSRIMAQPLSASLGQPVMVENRPGGNAMIGYDAVSQAPRDGYTWLTITVTHAVNQSLLPVTQPPRVGLSAGFTPLALMARSPLVVVVHPRVPASNLVELAKLARTRALTAGSSGNGTPPHLGLALLESAMNVDLIHVPYKGGAPSVVDLVAGQIDLIVSNLPESIAQIRAGKLRALAVTSLQRSPLLPDVPTTLEAGFPDIQLDNWVAFVAPHDTPPAITMRVARDIELALAQPETRQRIEAQGFIVQPMVGRELSVYLANEVARWARVVTDKRIKPE
jgi:tripartite-type tricarboxylate transporter receptor subunit TctC